MAYTALAYLIGLVSTMHINAKDTPLLLIYIYSHCSIFAQYGNSSGLEFFYTNVQKDIYVA